MYNNKKGDKQMKYKKIQGSKADINKELEHVCRGQDGGKEHNHRNEKIDKTKTKNNYELHDRQGETAKKYFREKMKYIEDETKKRTGKSIRKDAIRLCSWVITAPEDLPQDKYKDFFETSYEWLCQRHGKQNVITSAVHLDETSPHMHFQFVPIVTTYDEQGNQIDRLCAKNLETDETLRKSHRELKKVLEDKLKCKVNILNGKTVGKGKKIEELKLETLKEETKNAEKELNDLKKQVQKFKKNQKSNINNLISAIPPLILEPYPPKPEPPEKPEWHSCYADKKAEREDKKIWKQYDKDLETYNDKILPKWKQDCDAVDERNAEKRKNWESKYMTTENIKKAENQISMELSQVRADKQQAQEQLRKAEEERAKSEQERKQAEEEHKQQVNNYQNDLQKGIQEEMDKITYKRLVMSFNEVLEYAETKLQEEKQEEIYDFEDDFFIE